MRFLILFAVLIAYASASSVLDLAKSESEWNIYKQKYGKTYQSEIEEEFRRKIFMDNKRKIEEHNEQFEKGLVTYKMGLNKYADLLHSEFLQMTSEFKGNVNNKRNFGSQKSYVGSSNQDLPKEVDWRKRGAVTRVKDQGRCGSCYAFAAVGSLEAQHFLKTGKLVELSEQNIIDCSQLYGNNECKGGHPVGAFQYTIYNKGIDTEESYPYVGIKKNYECKFNETNVGATVKDFNDIELGNEDILKDVIATVGPAAACIDDTNKFQFYESGIFYDPKCSSTHLHHAVLIVGYGTDTKTQQDYWIVKNSWSSDWGENGFGKIARNRNNHCGIASDISYPEL